MPGTPIYRQVVNENLWWSGRGLDDVILQRESLIKVDGFNSPYEFESFVRETNKKAKAKSKKENTSPTAVSEMGKKSTPKRPKVQKFMFRISPKISLRRNTLSSCQNVE